MPRQSFHEQRSRSGSRRFWARFRQGTVLLACLMSTACFAYHACYGHYGMTARAELIERASLLDFELQSLDTVRSKLERDVALLSPEVPNSDFVEETARDVLGYVYPADRIVPLH